MKIRKFKRRVIRKAKGLKRRWRKRFPKAKEFTTRKIRRAKRTLKRAYLFKDTK